MPPIVHPNAVEELKCNIVHLLRDSIVTTLHGTARFVQLLEDFRGKGMQKCMNLVGWVLDASSMKCEALWIIFNYVVTEH